MEPMSIASAWGITNYALFALSGLSLLCDVIAFLTNAPSYAHSQGGESPAEASTRRLSHICSMLCSGLAFLRFFLAVAVTIATADISRASSLWAIPCILVAICVAIPFGEWCLKHGSSIEDDYTWAHIVLDITPGICVWIWGISMYLRHSVTDAFENQFCRPLLEHILRISSGYSENQIQRATCSILAACFPLCTFLLAAYGLVNATSTLQYLENGAGGGGQAWALGALALYLFSGSNASYWNGRGSTLAPGYCSKEKYRRQYFDTKNKIEEKIAERQVLLHEIQELDAHEKSLRDQMEALKEKRNARSQIFAQQIQESAARVQLLTDLLKEFEEWKAREEMTDITTPDDKTIVSLGERENLDSIMGAALGMEAAMMDRTVLTPTDGRIQFEHLKGRTEQEDSSFFMNSRT
ncbi:hypothetical protein H2201_000637 [Coniosporium apollinis]|uniref:Uncharacterized protein n=1 Tax=Coniosporium apollinis TaxID=61459 RepID=A0ABQ9P3W9_9PEZI|nr:hypothetical protein H2201_000637 [Coniosporium apollinis]